MSNPGRYDFEIFAGQSVNMSFFWKGPDGAPIDTEGMSFRFVAKPSLSSPALSFDEVLALEDGRIVLALSDEQTGSIACDSLFYTAKAETATDVYPLLYGKITIRREVF